MAHVMCSMAMPSCFRQAMQRQNTSVSACPSISGALWRTSGTVRRTWQRQSILVHAAAGGPGADGSKPLKAESIEEEEVEEILSPEEDWVVPGGANDSLSSNTELGRAVRSACDELDTLGRFEADVQAEAEQLLRKLGYTGESLTRERPAEQDE